MCDVEKLSRCKTNNNSLIVDGDALFALRSSTINVLNALENIMIAWQLDIVDKTTIENEFKSFVDYSSGKMLLYNMVIPFPHQTPYHSQTAQKRPITAKKF